LYAIVLLSLMASEDESCIVLYGPNIKSFICFLLVPYQLLINYSYVMVCLPVLCLMPCPIFLWGPPGLLAAGACCWVGWGLRSLNAAFHCRSCLSCFINYVRHFDHFNVLIDTYLF
jgi:hypothetical protein